MSTFTTTVNRLLHRFRCDERGATAVEYAIVAAGVGAALAGTIWGMGTSLKNNFYDTIAALF